MPKTEELKQIVSEVFEENFNALDEKFQKRVSEINEKLEGVEKEMEMMKVAKDFVDEKTKMSDITLAKVGNTVKKVFGVLKDENAPTLKAAISGSDADTGEALMDSELYKGIIRIAGEYGVVMKFADVRPVGSRTLDLVKEAGGNDHPLTSIGGYDNELADRTEEALKFIKDEVNVKKWRRIIASSKEAIEDSAPEDLGAYIVTILSESVAVHTDKKGFETIAGNSDTPVLQLSGNAFTWDELIDVQALVERAVLSRSAYFMNRRSWNAVKKLKDNNGRPLVDVADKSVLKNANFAGGVGITPVGYIDIYPVYLVDERALADYVGQNQTGKAVAFFGDLNNALVVGVRREFNVEENDSQRFTEDIVLIKGSMRKVEVSKIATAMAMIKN